MARIGDKFEITVRYAVKGQSDIATERLDVVGPIREKLAADSGIRPASLKVTIRRAGLGKEE